jgi:hypothetical protein
LYEKIIAMQESLDNDYREFLEREEELFLMEKEELIKHILRVEKDYRLLWKQFCENLKDEELPW